MGNLKVVLSLNMIVQKMLKEQSGNYMTQNSWAENLLFERIDLVEKDGEMDVLNAVKKGISLGIAVKIEIATLPGAINVEERDISLGIAVNQTIDTALDLHRLEDLLFYLSEICHMVFLGKILRMNSRSLDPAKQTYLKMMTAVQKVAELLHMILFGMQPGLLMQWIGFLFRVE